MGIAYCSQQDPFLWKSTYLIWFLKTTLTEHSQFNERDYADECKCCEVNEILSSGYQF